MASLNLKEHRFHLLRLFVLPCKESNAQNDPRQHGICILVIHGAGDAAWRSTSTESKFVIINLAVKTIAVKRMRISKKRATTAIYVEEANADQMTGAIFWDGKKYHYEPLGSGMEE